MKEFNDYEGIKKKKPQIRTCVSIREDQKQFLIFNNINLSEVVRDVIDDLKDASNVQIAKGDNNGK